MPRIVSCIVRLRGLRVEKWNIVNLVADLLLSVENCAQTFTRTEVAAFEWNIRACKREFKKLSTSIFWIHSQVQAK